MCQPHMWPVNRLESQLVGNFKPIGTALQSVLACRLC